MRIPTYQVYNVLQQYTGRLTGGGGERDGSGLVQASPMDDTGFLAAIKRIELFGLIAETIGEPAWRITAPGLAERQSAAPLPAAARKDPAVKNGGDTPFVYNTIDEDQRKVKRSIPVTKFYER